MEKDDFAKDRKTILIVILGLTAFGIVQAVLHGIG